MTRRLDRYLFLELLKATGTGSLVALVVLIGLQVLRLSDLVIRFGLESTFILRMLYGLGTSFTPLVVPIALLFALLGVFGRMSTDREFVAAQAMGLSNRRLLLPALVFGLFAALVTTWISFTVGPRGNRIFENSVDEAFKRRVTTAVRSGTFSEDFLNMVLFVDYVDPLTRALNRVFIHDESSFRDAVSISAKLGEWIESQDAGSGVLRLHQGLIVSENKDRSKVRRIHFDEYRLNTDFARPQGWSRQTPPSMDWDELRLGRAANGDKPDVDPRPVWVEIARRFALVAVCLLFVPLAYGLSLDNRRTARGRAVFTGLIVLFTYWTLYFTLVTWVMKTPLPQLRHEPVVWGLIWLPNLAVAAAAGAIFFARFSARRRSTSKR